MEHIIEEPKFRGIFIIDGVEENNTITNGGLEILTGNQLACDPDNILHNIVMGRDIGTGTNLEPQAASRGLTSADQTVVYEIPHGDISISQSGTSIIFEVELDGSDIFDGIPETNHIYTSATLRTAGGATVAYKRFRIRTLTEQTTLNIKWEIILT